MAAWHSGEFGIGDLAIVAFDHADDNAAREFVVAQLSRAKGVPPDGFEDDLIQRAGQAVGIVEL